MTELTALLFIAIMFTIFILRKVMNRTECDILKLLAEKTYTSHREISEATKYSLGIVNLSLRFLIKNNYIDR